MLTLAVLESNQERMIKWFEDYSSFTSEQYGIILSIINIQRNDLTVFYKMNEVLDKVSGEYEYKDENMELKINSFIGSMNEDIDIIKTGKDLMIGFNPKFILDALRVIDDENIDIYMINPKAPCFIRDEDKKYIYLILPVNFNPGV